MNHARERAGREKDPTSGRRTGAVAAAAVWLASALAPIASSTAATAIISPATVATAPAAPQKSVWDGVYTEAQATRGQEAYRQQCAGCHLDNLGGADMAPALAGDAFKTQWNELTVGDLFDRIRISMPQDTPASLPRQSYADIVAYILKTNAFPSGGTELNHDIAELKTIAILTKRP